MKQKRKKAAIPALLSAVLLLSGCQSTSTAESTQSPAVQSGTGETETAAVSTGGLIHTGDLFTDRDLDAGYDESEAVRIQLNGDTASCASDTVNIDGGTVTIGEEGVYVLSGTLNDGQIIVSADDADKVQLVLSGVNITSTSSGAIYAMEADKVFVTLADGTKNTLTNGGEYIAIDDNNVDAVVFAKTDLTLNGSGSLTVNAPAGHGIVSKDDLVIGGGTYNINAAGHGMIGKDSVCIADVSITITAGKDGIHAENKEDASLGYLYVANGSFSIQAQGDAVSASGSLQIDNGKYTLITAGGSATVTLTSDASGFVPGQRQEVAVSEETDESEKGIKSDGSLTINGGVFSVDTADDAIHAGGDIEITAGEFTLKSGDDGIHSDGAVTVNGGGFSIPYCYEGVEGQSVTVNDGTFDIVSSDDGFNAADGADSSSFGGGRDQFAANEDCIVLVNGGTITVVSDGDSIDSNGEITINGGTLDLTCNGNGNTAIDANGAYTNNGGSVSTNDGSESGTGDMGGGPRGGMQGGTGGLNPGGRPGGTGTADAPSV